MRTSLRLAAILRLALASFFLACLQLADWTARPAKAAPLMLGTYASDAPELPMYDPHAFELRGGFQVEARQSNEYGTVDVGGDLVFPRFFTLSALPDVLTPRFQIGGMFNTAGRTDFVHADLLWTANYTDRIFSDLFFGVTVHDGHLGHDSPEFNALGCRALFHVGADVGYRFTPRWSAMVVLDHSSAGTGLTNCSANQSLNQVGLKFGYRF